MAQLSHREKQALVIHLACFRSPSEIARQMADEFGSDISIQQIVKYDPTRSVYEGGQVWRSIFEGARESYLKDIASIPIAHQGYRLRLIQRGISHAEKHGNWKLVGQLLEQAAKEIGGTFANARELNLSESSCARRMSPEERRALLTAMFEEA